MTHPTASPAAGHAGTPAPVPPGEYDQVPAPGPATTTPPDPDPLAPARAQVPAHTPGQRTAPARAGRTSPVIDPLTPARAQVPAPASTASPVIDPLTLVVLDMAGTTVADDGLVERAFSRAAEEVGVEPGSPRHARHLEYVRATMGESKISVFRALFGTEEHARRANAAFERAYAELVDSGVCAPLPGAEETIGRLRADGRTVVLTTGFSRTTQDAILAALGWQDIADLTLCPADAGRGRPYPDMVLTALLRTGAESVRRIAVAGDTAYDMLSGVRAGAAVVAGVTTGAHAAPELRAAGATHVLPSVAELPSLLAESER